MRSIKVIMWSVYGNVEGRRVIGTRRKRGRKGGGLGRRNLKLCIRWRSRMKMRNREIFTFYVDVRFFL